MVGAAVVHGHGQAFRQYGRVVGYFASHRHWTTSYRVSAPSLDLTFLSAYRSSTVIVLLDDTKPLVSSRQAPPWGAAVHLVTSVNLCSVAVRCEQRHAFRFHGAMCAGGGVNG